MMIATRFLRACLLVAACATMFGFGSCLSTKWVGNVVTEAAGVTAAELLDIFVIQDLTRDARIDNLIADQESFEQQGGSGG